MGRVEVYKYFLPEGYGKNLKEFVLDIYLIH
jgi:hypothetical protein